MAGAIDPLGQKNALDAFLETKVAEDHHRGRPPQIALEPLPQARRRQLLRGSVDEHGEVTMIPAEPKRN
jgi:hypothetical protein